MKLIRTYVWCALPILCLLVYYNICFHEFQTLWDDHWVVLNRYTRSGVNFVNIGRILTQYFHGQYAPVNELSYLVLYSVFGRSPGWFHLFGLLVHTANVLLTFLFIKRLLLLSRNFQQDAAMRIAFITATLVAVHPFLVESVAWVSASKIINYVLFYLLSLLFYLKFISTGKSKFLVWTGVFFIISFGAKEQAVTMPLCLVLLDYVLGRDLKDRRIWMEKIPFFVLSLFFGVVTMLSQAADGVGVLSENLNYPFYQNILFACYAFIEYFIKCVIPVKLSYLYPFPNPIGDPVPGRFWMYPFLLIVIIVALWRFLKEKWVSFGLLFFLIHIGLALHIIPLSRFAIVADRYVYLASIGVFFMMGYLFNHIYEKSVSYRQLFVSIAAMYIVCLAVYAHERTKVWHNTDTLKAELRKVIKSRSDYEALKEKQEAFEDSQYESF
ncbi:hypothetical protein [Chitinophaga sp. YR627]|uniref:hypothetical protein n=1 Tax=Chitinophaga sp. YR627 TaxID=1881041 RepID=UPI000B7E22B6|nr:hypothetical protein [Chitinophaga sp. YR627]